MGDHLVLRRLVEACRNYTGGSAPEGLRRLGEDFVIEAGKNHVLLDNACAELASLPPHGAAWLGVQLGLCAVQHHTAARTINPLLSLFLGWIERLPRPESDSALDDEEASPLATTPEQDILLEAIVLLAPSLIAHLARVPMRRKGLVQDAALMKRLAQVESCSEGISWIVDALRRRSGTLVVLHPTSRVGYQMRYDNLLNCFHLFSLLQCALGTRVEGGHEPSDVILAAARGEIGGHFIDKGWWHFGDPRTPRPELLASVWGEKPVSDIPLINGSQVLLLWPQLPASRSWDSSYFDTALADFVPAVNIERELTFEEVSHWLQRLGISTEGGPVAPPPDHHPLPLLTPDEPPPPPPPRRRWWKFWS